MVERDSVKKLLDYLGGADNIVDIIGCITRLRITVNNATSILKNKEKILNDFEDIKKFDIVGQKYLEITLGSKVETYRSLLNDILNEVQRDGEIF